MATAAPVRPYELVHQLLKKLDPGGNMTWHPGGSQGGGTWILTLHGRQARVPIHNRFLNQLDDHCVPKTPNPKTSDDYKNELRDDAFWRLVALFPS
jgi:hypothetical protein